MLNFVFNFSVVPFSHYKDTKTFESTKIFCRKNDTKLNIFSPTNYLYVLTSCRAKPFGIRREGGTRDKC
nr:MAG TPA: hypothetical protein [Caudoviricetes sp.]